MMIKIPIYVFAVPTAPTALSPTVESMIVSTMPASIMNSVSSAIGIYNFIKGFITAISLRFHFLYLHCTLICAIILVK